jgi:hypothetical protein
MNWYRRADVIAWLEAAGCEYRGDAFVRGLGFFGPDSIPFTLSDPDDDGWLNADIVDRIVADRWIGAGVGRPQRFPNKIT